MEYVLEHTCTRARIRYTWTPMVLRLLEYRCGTMETTSKTHIERNQEKPRTNQQPATRNVSMLARVSIPGTGSMLHVPGYRAPVPSAPLHCRLPGLSHSAEKLPESRKNARQLQKTQVGYSWVCISGKISTCWGFFFMGIIPHISPTITVDFLELNPT